MTLRIVCIGDTHSLRRELILPPGDLLVHAGDLDALSDLNACLGNLPRPHKVVIAGNYDWCCQQEPEATAALRTSAHYPEDAELVVAGLRPYGSPWGHDFDGWAFTSSAIVTRARG